MCGLQTCSAADIARELDIKRVVHRIVWDQLFTEKCVHMGHQIIPQMMTKFIVWDCMGLSFIHWTCYTDQRDQFGAETWLIMQNLKLEKGCVIEKLSSPYSKENGSIVISKVENCLGTINMCLFCISLTMLTLC